MQNDSETMLIRRTLSYLKAFNREGALLLSEEIKNNIPTVMEKSNFKACHEPFSMERINEIDSKVLLAQIATGSRIEMKSDDLCKLLRGCTEVFVISSTLGIEVDRYVKRVMSTDASKGVIVDALFSSYLESLTDEYEDRLISSEHTFRFAPGYGDLDISYNKIFYDLCGIEKKLGITIASGGIFLPQKSMLGIVGTKPDSRY